MQGSDVSTAGRQYGFRKNQSEVGQRRLGDVDGQEVNRQEGGTAQVISVFTEKSRENRVLLPRKK